MKKNRPLRSSYYNKQIEEFLSSVVNIHIKQYQEGRSAIAWMRAQAKALDPSISDNKSVAQCARIIASYIKK
jgi:hypothetical protein